MKQHPVLVNSLALATLTAALVGCASHPAPVLAPTDACARTVLVPSPLLTASFAWRSRQDGIVLVDQGGKDLMVFNADGGLDRRVGSGDGDAIHGLDYINPVTLRTEGDGYTLRDRSRLLTLDHDFQVIDSVTPLEGDAMTGILGDVVPLDGRLVGYLDLRVGEDPEAPWQRGFGRVDLDRPGNPEGVHFFLNLPLARDGEYERYYHYDVRPYVAALGGKVYFLRLTDEPQLVRAVRGGIHTVATIPLPDGGRPVALYGWEKWLFLLTRAVPIREVNPLAAMPEPPDLDWILDRIDPKDGKILQRFELPTHARRLQLAPGVPRWAVLEESSEPNLGGDRPSQLLTLDSRLLRGTAKTPGAAEVLCPELLPPSQHEGDDTAP